MDAAVPWSRPRELDRVGKTLGLVVLVIAAVMIGTILLVEDVHGPCLQRASSDSRILRRRTSGPNGLLRNALPGPTRPCRVTDSSL